MNHLPERIDVLLDNLDTITHEDVRIGRACLASILDESYVAYSPTDKSSFAEYHDLLTGIIDQIDLPQSLEACDVSHSLPGKRYPNTREAITATLDRYNALFDIKDAFSAHTTGALYGGSLAYGPFFSVRSGVDASDIDIVMQLDEDDGVANVWDSVVESAIVTEQDAITFTARLPIFQQLLENNEAEIISQRFDVAETDFNCSIHFMTRQAISEVFGERLYETLAEHSPQKKIKYMKDYKATSFERASCTNFDTSGRPYTVGVMNDPSIGGFVAHIPAYTIQDGRFAPGLYQCLALPKTTLVYDGSHEFNAVQNMFHSTINNRIDYERTLYDADASLEKINPRRTILPPHAQGVLREIGL